MRYISSARNWLVIVLCLAASGIFYSTLAYPNGRVVTGAVFATCMGMPIFAFERQVLFRRLYRRIQKFSTVAFIISALCIYVLLMHAGFALAAVLMHWAQLVTIPTWTSFFMIPFDSFLYASGVCALIIFVLRVRELLGADVFSSMLIGRYRTPVREERVFLFIDLADSTPFAEKHGDLRTQQLLKALFATFAEPVRRHRGTIDDYVGDAAIITWPLERGIKDARCIDCIFDILDIIDANAPEWLKKFGQVPRLRAALHGGTIITAEIGVDHHKITYFGDTVNTTARLETLCRTLDRPILISAELARRIVFPATVTVENMGGHAVQGRGQTLEVMALARPTQARLPMVGGLRIPAE